MRLATPLALLVVVLAAALSFAAFQQGDLQANDTVLTTVGSPSLSAPTHPMGPQCDPSYPAEVCRTTVEQLKALEGTGHPPITVDWQKQQSIFISGSKPFTLHIKALDGGVEPFYRSFPESRGKEVPSNSVSTGPARKEAGGHQYQLIFRDENGDVDPHIVIVPSGSGGG